MKPLTDEQLERAARKLCELRGVDPDATVAHEADPSPSGFVPAICLFSPAWSRAAREIRAHEALDIALRFGRGE